MAKYPPTGAILNSIVNDRLDWKTALGEVIDNAIDANARRVQVLIGPMRDRVPLWIRVEDDGDGCANLIDMVRLGSHTDHRTTLLGRFGIGAKNAFLWIGGGESSVDINSVRATISRRLKLPWAEYAKEWEIDESLIVESHAQPGKRGTEILIKPCIRRFPTEKRLDDLCDELGYLYSPAIKNLGVQIQIRLSGKKSDPIVLKRWELPELTDVVDQAIDVGGRRARVRAGIIASGGNRRPGLTYCHGFRVIKPACGLGCERMDYSGICGFVELDRSWHLTKNKDDVSQHQDELAAAVFLKVRPLLEKAAQRDQALQCSQFDEAVERAINDALGVEPNAKGKRTKGNEAGTHSPKGTKRRQRRAKDTQDGATFARTVGGLKCSYRDLVDPEQLGTHSGDGRVILNLANPFVASIRSEQNVQAVVLSALVVFWDSLQNEGMTGQRAFRFASSGELCRDVGRVLAQPSHFDGKPVLEVVEGGKASAAK